MREETMSEAGAQAGELSAAVVATACEACQSKLAPAEWRRLLWVCPSCDFPNPMPARARLSLVTDPGSLGDIVVRVTGGDPLGFSDQRPYPARLDQARTQSGEDESFIAAPATIGGVPAVVGAFDFAFMGGTMSVAAGERVAEVFDRAGNERRAVVLCTSSGGARMQEGTLALFQMTKTVAALARFRAARRPYVTVLCHPTLGGVGASFATRADVLIAEPRARIGFAGPRVIEQLLGHALPAVFQRAEFLREHGFVDRVVPRQRLHDELARLLPMLSGGDTRT
jgi:acetyl-CoA carboxylase carboxyl transferase subunit beta